MSDDSFIREVDEELRQDQFKSLWNRFGNIIIAVAVLIVVATGSYRFWENYTSKQAAASGDAFLSAIDLAAQGKQDDAIAKFDELAKSGHGQYPALARLRVAGEKIARGDAAGAIADFDALAGDGAIPEPLRSVASLRAGMAAVDTETYEQVKARLESLAAAGGHYRHLAREALGLSALRNGADQEALVWFQSIVDDAGSAGNVRTRATIMLDLLAGRGVKSAG
ncbi:MAG: tetratricopeptide repeat protein [Rhizobiaceae bacterium]